MATLILGIPLSKIELIYESRKVEEVNPKPFGLRDPSLGGHEAREA